MPGTQSSSKEQRANSEKLPNILVFVYDALSARNMSLYGYERKTTPNIDQLAERGVVFHRHHAAGNFTSPGVASLFTGVYPWSHRAFHTFGMVDKPYIQQNLFELFVDRYHTFGYSHNTFVNVLFHQLQAGIDHLIEHHTLSLESLHDVERFISNDWIIATQVENLALWRAGFPPTSFFLSRFYQRRLQNFRGNLMKELEGVFPRGIPNSGLVSFTIEDSINWLTDYLPRQEAPFLGYIHLWPPHTPYATRKEFIDIFDDGWKPPAKPAHIFSEGYPDTTLNLYRRHYDEFISYADSEFKRLFDFMQREGLLDNTIVVLTSDHGEMFERGIWAHNTPTMYQPILNVPLIIWRPETNQRVDIYEPTSCIDLLPTLQYLSGGQIPQWSQGRSLPGFSEEFKISDRAIFAIEAKENPKYAPLKKATFVVIKGQYKLIHYIGYREYDGHYELYDLEQDPEELNNIYSPANPIAVDLQYELDKHLSSVE
ncbi:sulfatase [Chloroflexota bacterium]